MTEQIMEGLLKWLISVMNRDKFLMDHILLSRDKKALFRLTPSTFSNKIVQTFHCDKEIADHITETSRVDSKLEELPCYNL